MRPLLFVRAEPAETFGVGPSAVRAAGGDIEVWDAIGGVPRPDPAASAGVVLFGSSFNVDWLDDAQWAALLGLAPLVGWWACTVTARHLRTADPGAIVWDEVLAFWAVLWLVTPAGLGAQLVAFALFRFFDAAKPGPVAWADAFFKRRRDGRPIGWAQGFGILFDDAVAALCTLLVIALWRF